VLPGRPLLCSSPASPQAGTSFPHLGHDCPGLLGPLLAAPPALHLLAGHHHPLHIPPLEGLVPCPRMEAPLLQCHGAAPSHVSHPAPHHTPTTERALAKMNGRQAYILPEMHQQLVPLFRITLPVLSSDVVRSVPWKDYELHNWMSEEYRHIEGKYVRLTGYPCSWTFYHHLRQEILQEFSFHDHVKEEANRYLAGLRGQRQNMTYMGIHVRRGDDVRLMPQVWKGVVADKAYLEKAMGYFRAKYQELVFVVTSNGMEWCRENIDASRGDVYFSGDRKESSPGRDFALLVHCNHTIMTIWSFGIWASYLAWFLKPSAAFLPKWIGIDTDLSPLVGLWKLDPVTLTC
uniref:L-Fucosyltransferase n=1 Tax=Terrapene triunguis TaxID=2587831 RepID=A0A674K8F3_9SAUR